MTSSSVPSAAELQRVCWDVIVIGTGMGGATLGYALAKSGKSVLFLEKGRSHYLTSDSLRGGYAECFFPHPDAPSLKHRNILKHAGRYFDEITDISTKRPFSFIPFIGSGSGGSSAIYGAALERFFPSDFTPRSNYPNATDSTLPEKWPVTYEQMCPYYETAETLYGVHGTIDPYREEGSRGSLLSPSPLSSSAYELHCFFSSKGLHPYHLPLACETNADCLGCQGFLCRRRCRNDSVQACLEPAIEAHGASLLDECEVVRLEATSSRVSGVHCLYRAESVVLQAEIVVLAAGALETPRLLLRSGSPSWPNGLANASGLVGKNLMRHFVDLWAVYPKEKPSRSRNTKEIAFNDFYQTSTGKFGTVQSFGALPPPFLLAAGMEKDLRAGPLSWLAPPLRLARPLIQRVLEHQLSDAVVFASIMEDLPYENNQVMLPREGSENSRVAINYRIRPYDQARIKIFRERLRSIFQPYRFIHIKQAENNQRIAHACGTCRFGDDPATSVLNRSNRAHEVDNLYVVDSSFFPSSGGTNPSLTIAANALRVAAQILQKA